GEDNHPTLGTSLWIAVLQNDDWGGEHLKSSSLGRSDLKVCSPDELWMIERTKLMRRKFCRPLPTHSLNFVSYIIQPEYFFWPQYKQLRAARKLEGFRVDAYEIFLKICFVLTIMVIDKQQAAD